MTPGAVAGAAALLVVCSLAIGSGVWRVAGFARWSPLSVPVGLAAMEVLCLVGVELPGRRVTAALLVVAATVAGAAASVGRIRRRELGLTALALVGGALAAALPFLAWGRVGILGVTDNADLSAHLVLANAVGTGHPPVGLDPGWYANYPTGPHALVATLHAATGIAIDAAFNGLLVAIVAVSVAAALALFRETSRPRALAGALLAGIPYLGAFYTVQSSFKETLLGMLLVAWTLVLPLVARDVARRPRAIVPAAVLAAAAYATYNFVALAWLGAIAGCALTAWVVQARRLPSVRLSRRALATSAVFILVLAAIALPLASQTRALVSAVKATAGGQTGGGNIRADLAAYQVFGLWPTNDPRTYGASLTLMRFLGVCGAVAVVWAAIWWWRRRRVELPAAVLATVLIYALVRSRATPYYSAKALVLAAFPVGLMIVGAVVLALPRRAELRRLGIVRAAGVVAGVAFLALAGWSSALALRGGRVEPPTHRHELASLRPLLAEGPTLYTGQNDYIAWFLRSAQVSYPYSYMIPSQYPLGTRPEKPWLIEYPFDFDNLPASQLDQFRFVLTSRTPYASTPPPNWRLLRTTRSYEVWSRRGPTAARSVLPDERGRPGAVLDCSTPEGAALARQPGVAAVRPAPVVVGPHALRAPNGRALERGEFGFSGIAPGGTAVAHVALPPGRWTASLQYVSPVDLELRAGGSSSAAPASQEGPGAFWVLGTFTSRGGAQRIMIHARAASALTTFRTALLGSLALTRAGSQNRLIPLRSACGGYVDWYRAGG